MWTCSNCSREFERAGQSHSCKTKSIDEHFRNKDLAHRIYLALSETLLRRVGPCKELSLPCCVHLVGSYDFLAALPKKSHLEIRFALSRELSGTRIAQSVPVSRTVFKNCVKLNSESDIDDELMGWLREAYYLKASSGPSE